MPSPEFMAATAAALKQTLRGLPPREQVALLDTEFYVQNSPTWEQRAAVTDGGILLGLYTYRAPAEHRIFLFEENIRRVGRPVRDVIEHETWHRLGRLSHPENSIGPPAWTAWALTAVRA